MEAAHRPPADRGELAGPFGQHLSSPAIRAFHVFQRKPKGRVNMLRRRVNGYDMAYIEVGEGPLLICVHGTLGDFRV
jgi:hypothetical protein